MDDWAALTSKYGAKPQQQDDEPQDEWGALAAKHVPVAAVEAPSSGQRSLSDLVTGKRPAAAPLTRMDKYVKGLRDPIDGGAQLLVNALPKNFVQGVNKVNNWLADNTGIVDRLPEGGVDEQTRSNEKEYQRRRAAQGETGFDGYRLTGNVINPANMAIASRAPAVASLVGRIGVGAGLGAVNGALTPVGEGDFWSEKRTQIGAGAAVGGALPGVAAAAGRIISPLASKNKHLQLLRSEGVGPTIGQAMGGMANRIEEKATSIPLIGDMISRARRMATEDFEKAAFDRALKPVGQTLPKGITGRDAVVHTENVLKEKYSDVLTKIGAIRPDAQFNAKVAELRALVQKMPDSGGVKDKFDNSIREVANSIDQRGYITSDAFKTLESSLGTDARKLAGSQDIWDGKVAPAVKQLQEELREMLRRQAGSHADDLRATNAGWANFKRAQGASAKVGADDGKFSPAQFQNSVRSMDKSKDKAAFARGSALGQDLGDAGKVVLGNKVPNSFTGDRVLMAAGMGGLSTIHPAIAAAVGGGTLAYTRPAQRALVGAIASRPQGAESVAEFLRRTSPYLTGASTPIGYGLLGE